MKALNEHISFTPLSTEDNQSQTNKEFSIKFGDEFGIKFGINDKKLLLLLHSNPSLTGLEIAERIGLSQRGVEKQMKRLKELGVISRQGGKKNGLWVINNK